jgi:arylsulfatase A-like enzyme
MITKTVRLLSVVACVPFGYILSDACRAADTHKLNVLFLISDDLRAELGCYGSALAKTPNIDKLAAAGVRFERAYCQFPLCNPSRSSMLNSRLAMHTSVLDNRAYFRDAHPDWVTLPQLFRQHGYATLRTGKIFHGGIDDLPSWTEGGDPRRNTGEGAMRLLDPDELSPASNGPREEALVSAPRDGTSLLTCGAIPGGDEFIFIDNPSRKAWSASDDAGLTKAQRSDRWLVLDGDGEIHGDYQCCGRAIDFLRRYKDKPFFLACGFVKPHSPPTAPKKFFDKWDAGKIPLPPDFAPRPTVPEGFPVAAIRPKNADLFIGRAASQPEAREMIRAYLASSSWVDWLTGRVLAELDRLGLRERTVIVFWGDHGYQLGEKGKWSKAGSLFEQGDRTPFIIVAPGAKGNGQSCVRTVQALDFYPTLADLCGLTPPKEIEGRSLVPLLNDPKAEWKHPAFTVWSEDGKTLHGVAVRTEKYRYAEFGENAKNGAMLFDEAADPHEMKNLANDPSFVGVRKELSAHVKNYLAGTEK